METMKRFYAVFTPLTVAALTLVWACLAFAADPPHTDYRAGYKSGCFDNGAACHAVTKGSFIPASLGMSPSDNYTTFCLSCHSAAGEAHEKSPGLPSTNVYVNKTGFNPFTTYKGVSHSWRGVIGNAGTRTPTDPGMYGATYMPGGKVLCQTCHSTMYKNQEQSVDWVQAVDTGDHTNYTLSGYTTIFPDLAQYVKVYRTTSQTGRFTNSRTKKASLVDPSSYSFTTKPPVFTFKSAQTATSFIYVDVSEPYLRASNYANHFCEDCHADRVDSRVKHPGDTPGRDNHPIGVRYGKTFGTRTTLRNLTAVRLYMESGTVLCTTCHDPHNAKSDDGRLLRETTPDSLCADCHSPDKVTSHRGGRHAKYANGSTIPTTCTQCHTPHKSDNMYLIRNNVKQPGGGIKPVVFRSFTGQAGFGPDTGSGICEACHTATGYHKSDGSGKGHNTKKDCQKCHKHEKGFEANGGTAPCYECHDGSSAPNIKALMGLGTTASSGGKASRHRISFDNESGSSCLSMCHTSKHVAGGPNTVTAPESALCLTCHNGAAGKTSRGKSINVGGNYATSLHNYTATVQDEFGLFKYSANCTKCHTPHGSDNYPNVRTTINDRATNGDTEDLCFGCHAGNKAGAANIEALWKASQANPGHYDYAGGKRMACVTCHGPHGTSNSKMISDSLGGPGLSRDAICRACHGGDGGSVYNVMGSEPGSYGPDFSAGSVHQFGLNVAVGGHTVDLTCQGCHDPHNTQNARLLQDKVVFSGISAARVMTVSATVQPRGAVTQYISGWTDYCATCHTSIKDTGGQSPYRRHPLGVEPGAFYPYTTGMGVKKLPLESGGVACVTCHYTHGSPKHSLLRMQDADTPDNRLCMQCHDRSKFMQGGAGSHGGFLQNQGRCSDCHSLHSKGNKRLLQEATESVLCERCHAGGTSRYNVWRDLTTMDPARYKGTAGTFGRYSEARGGTEYSMHAINDEATAAPGGSTTQHRCGSCHNPHGSANYRVLRSTVNNVTGIVVTARVDAEGNFINYSTGVVKFCAACHTAYKTTKDDSANWIRHPVGVRLDNYSAQMYQFANTTSFTPKVELGNGGEIICLSCHFAHGSPANANLKFPSGRTVNACKTCHDRDRFNAGQPGSHAGFTGDGGTCSDCHSMHSSGQPKLLKGDADTTLCVNCHDNPGTSTSPRASKFDVWKGGVFNSPTSWFGTAGSFGSYDPVNGGDAYSMHPINSDARVAPGDGATVVHCGTCHDTHGSPNYRLLKSSLNGKSGISVTANQDAQGRTVSYNGGMSSFCTACHKAFIQYGSAAGYTRHPVDVALSAQELANYNHNNGGRLLPLEAGAKVTCTTCHFAHGSPNEKMKRLPGNQMCQICHAKGLDPAAGYTEVLHTHGGFTGTGGNCGACHSMHTSNNRKLLIYAEETELCYSCHATDGALRGSYPGAMVVWKGVAPSSPGQWDGTAGSFGAQNDPDTGGDIASHHKITRTDSAAPGGTTTEHHCGTCHDPHGNNNYRMLRETVNGKSGISVRVNVLGVYSSGISDFCSACHTAYTETGSGVDGYSRHPVNKALTAEEYSNISGTTALPKAQIEGRHVMCLTCHFAHGSPGPSMLRLDTYTSSAGGVCQQCHMKGYKDGRQVREPHGGFTGNGANCAVCHSMHAKDNRKLLMDYPESHLCENCHSGAIRFGAFKADNPKVKVERQSRFNVFTSDGNSFGNYSVGKGGVVSWHEIDGTHTAPGGKTLELRCGKCHNPHGDDNFAMLRDSVEGVDNIRVFGRVSSTGPFNTYSSGFGSFCSACHTRLTTCLSVVNNVTTITRHPVDFRLQKTQLHNWSTTTITPKVPLESGSRVTCITCHNSHGSKNYKLQRLGGNDMCQQCHNR